MTSALLAGLLAGYGIAIPVGAVGAYLVALTARTSLKVGASAALGVATADAGYALVAAVAGSSVARLLAPYLVPLRWTSAVVLLVIAVRGAARAVRDWRRRSEVVLETGTPTSPRRAYLMLLGMTLLNPTTVVYFTALAVGGSSATRPGTLDRAAFVVAAGTASASWQLLLAGGGAVLGYALTSPRGRLVTAGTSSLLISVLALRMLLG